MGFIEKQHGHCSSHDSFHFMAMLLSTKLAMPSATVLDPRAQKVHGVLPTQRRCQEVMASGPFFHAGAIQKPSSHEKD